VSFDQKLAKNVEEHSLSVFLHPHVLGLRTLLVFMHMHTYSCVCRLCSCICFRVFQFRWTHVPICVHMQGPYARMRGLASICWHSETLISIFLILFHLFPYPMVILMSSFHLFVGLSSFFR